MNKIIQVALLLLFSSTCLHAANAEDKTVIKISAKKFEFSPSEIVLKKGVPVLLQITSEDRSHGFNIPSLSVRADITPDKVSEISINPKESGEFEFFCDIFCGGGHETMNGKIKVIE